jgi:DNA-binding NarL/FixJ family response regulator
MTHRSPLRLLLVDNQPATLLALESLLADAEILVAEAATGAAALAALRTTPHDVVLLGHTRDQGDDETELARLRREFPRLPILVYSHHDEPIYMTQALVGGARGYLLASADRDEHLEAIRIAAQGESCWTAPQLERIAGPRDAGAPRRVCRLPLSASEREFLWRLGAGQPEADVAQELGVAPLDVHYLLRSLRRKLLTFGGLVLSL